MASYVYEGETEMVFPTIGVTVNYGDTFEAPEGFTAANVTASKNSSAKKPVASVVEDATPDASLEAGA
jgi:hypothetical protein